jgi:hypothetical protein
LVENFEQSSIVKIQNGGVFVYQRLLVGEQHQMGVMGEPANMRRGTFAFRFSLLTGCIIRGTLIFRLEGWNFTVTAANYLVQYPLS